MTTLVAFTGFEFGKAEGIGVGSIGQRVFDGITGTAGTDVKVTATSGPVAGNYVGEINLTAKNFFWNTDTIGTGKTVLVISMRFRLTTLPTTDTDIISMDTAASSDRAGFFYNHTTGKLHAWISSSNQASAATLSVNTWYTLQWRYDVTGTQALDWSLDGVAGTQVTNGAASTIARVAFGNRGAGTGTAQYDDVAASVTSGDHPLTMFKMPPVLVPDTAGTAVEIGTANATARFVTNNSIDATFNSANILAAISEVPPTVGASASGVAQRTSGAGNAVGIPMTSYTLTGGETIALARVIVCGWANGTNPNNFGVRAFNGSAETTLIGDVASGFTNDTTTPDWACKAYTGLTDQTTLDALVVRVGYSTDITPEPGAHAIYTELAIVPGSGGATPTPAAIAAVAALPTPTISAGSTPTPAAVTAVAALPTPTISAGVTETPATVAAVVAMPAPTVAAGSTTAPTTIAAVVALPAPTVAAASTTTPAAVAAVAALPAPTVAAGSTATPATVGVTVALPAPTVSAGGSVTVVPDAVAAAVAVPPVSISAGSTPTPAAIAATAALPPPVVSVSATVTPATIAVTVTVPTPQVSATGGATVTPATIATTVAFPPPTAPPGTPNMPPRLVHVRDGPVAVSVRSGPFTHIA